MPRIEQPKASKGSQKWLQELVNHDADRFAGQLFPKLGLTPEAAINWVSPLEADAFAEYHDESSLERLAIQTLERPLRTFWPSGGPHWDALGKTSRGDILLVEAKSHIGELKSDCKASPASLQLIQRSLGEAGKFYGANSTAAWSSNYYQYANRLAHLYFLRELNALPAWLISLYFVSDREVGGPGSEKEWMPEIETVHKHLGISPDRLMPHVIDLFVDVTKLRSIPIRQ